MKTKYLSFLIMIFVGVLPTLGNEWTLQTIRNGEIYLMVDREKDLELDLPIAEDGKRNKEEKVISILADGSVKMGGESYTLDTLQVELGRLVKRNKNQPIRVRGDAKVANDHIVRVIDRCRKAGVWNISFATGVPKQDAPEEEAKKSFRGKMLPVIDVGAKGGISMNGEKMTDAELSKKLRFLARVNANQSVVIRARAETPFKYIIKVTESCSKAKLTNVSFKLGTTGSSLQKPILK